MASVRSEDGSVGDRSPEKIKADAKKLAADRPQVDPERPAFETFGVDGDWTNFPRRRVLTAHEPWDCECGEHNPRYRNQCGQCMTRRG